jgi:hypothetical protein
MELISRRRQFLAISGLQLIREKPGFVELAVANATGNL